jgi:hypothetical protein
VFDKVIDVSSIDWHINMVILFLKSSECCHDLRLFIGQQESRLR